MKQTKTPTVLALATFAAAPTDLPVHNASTREHDMITEAKAREVLDDAWSLWMGKLFDEVEQEHVNHVEELLDLAGQAVERYDWTGVWMWAGTAIGYVRERVLPSMTTA